MGHPWNDAEQEAAFIEECAKRGVKVVDAGLLVIGTETDRAQIRHAHFETTPEAPILPTKGSMDLVADAMAATRVRFGLPPEAKVPAWEPGKGYEVGDEVEGPPQGYLSGASLLEWLQAKAAMAQAEIGEAAPHHVDLWIGRLGAIEEVIEYVRKSTCEACAHERLMEVLVETGHTCRPSPPVGGAKGDE